MKIRTVLLSLEILCLGPSLYAKDLGLHGATFPITETSLLKLIEERVAATQKDGKMAQIQEILEKKARLSVEEPHPVEGLRPTSIPRTSLYDPSIILKEDILDHKSQLIHKKGTRVNPLDVHSWGDPMILLDGKSEEQVNWAKTQPENTIWVLVSGSPSRTSNLVSRRIYFDQGGLITKKFKVKHVPCRISQKGKHLLIEELLPLEEKNRG